MSTKRKSVLHWVWSSSKESTTGRISTPAATVGVHYPAAAPPPSFPGTGSLRLRGVRVSLLRREGNTERRCLRAGVRSMRRPWLLEPVCDLVQVRSGVRGRLHSQQKPRAGTTLRKCRTGCLRMSTWDTGCYLLCKCKCRSQSRLRNS